MQPAHRRHDISDHTWNLWEPRLPGRVGVWGGVARDNRLFINAVFWILRTGVPWRDLPPDYGDWKNTHHRFGRWRDRGAYGNRCSNSSLTSPMRIAVTTATQLIVEDAQAAGMQVVIPPKKNRKVQRAYDKHVYRQRHLVESAFLHVKRWRGIATRYAKNTAPFLAAVQIRCLALWLNIS